jgi:hypothetical protein
VHANTDVGRSSNKILGALKNLRHKAGVRFAIVSKHWAGTRSKFYKKCFTFLMNGSFPGDMRL